MKKKIQCIFDILERSRSGYISLKVLKKKCGKHIRSTLKELEKQGKIVSKGEKFALPHKVGYIKGIFDGKSEGFGFLMPSSEMRDLFIAPGNTYTALNGDLVLGRIIGKSRGRWKAKIEKILERSRKYFIGEVISIDGKLMFKPQNKNIPHLFEIQEIDNKIKEGDYILVEFVKWTTTTLPPLVKFCKKINKSNLYKVIVKEEYNLENTFSKKALDEAKNFSFISTERREDFTFLKTFTIDPSDAKELDDAISVNKDNNGFHLWVHIAAVSDVVKKDSAIDKEAKERGCTTYLPNETYFMMPEEITRSLSLEENKKLPTITVYIKFDKKGNPIKKEFYKSEIKSYKKFSYEEAQEILDGKKNSELESDLQIASELAKILFEKRRREGYLDFYKEEVKVIFDNSEPVGILPIKELWTHKIIEQFMIAANEAVAEQLEKSENPGLYRIHEEPEKRELEQFKKLVENLGFHLPSLERKDLSKFLEEIKDSSYRRVLNYELLRCMKKARYIARPQPHYGLGSKLYTHFTSPIRRYPDIVVQRLLFGESYSQEELKLIADHATEQEWKADSAEREITTYFILRYLEKNPDKAVKGIITNVSSNGIWVELEDFLVTGFIPIRMLPPDSYKITNSSLSGKYYKFHIGDLLLCNIYTVSPLKGELTFEFAGKIEKKK
ncbi:MAG: VacB/RNase II family 3'-5' exoribonuclease [candidate division WOR-3 bacterium]